jgi:hypothetical protein
VFRNVGFYYSDAREIPRRQSVIKTTRRKLENYNKKIPLQAWADPEGYRKLRLSDFKTIDT